MSVPSGFRRVRRGDPCPVCGAPKGCLVEDKDEPTCAVCIRIESANRWGNAGCFHRLVDDPAPGAERHILRWTDGDQQFEVFLWFRRWRKHGHDRVYVAEVPPDGVERTLGYYDLLRRRWYTKGPIGDLSHARQDATKALVERVVLSLRDGGRP